MLMALYMHLGPFSKRVIGEIDRRIDELVSVAKRILSFKIAGFSRFFSNRFLDMSVCLWTHV